MWAYPDSPAPQEYDQRITNQVEAARAAHAGMFGTGCPTPASPPPPPPVVIPSGPGDSPTVAQLGQTITYPDGLTVSVAQPERHLVSATAALSQFRKTKALLVTTTSLSATTRDRGQSRWRPVTSTWSVLDLAPSDPMPVTGGSHFETGTPTMITLHFARGRRGVAGG